MNSKPHAKLMPKLDEHLIELAKFIKEQKEPIANIIEFKCGNYPNDIILHDNITRQLRELGWFSFEHFVEVIMNTTIEELEKHYGQVR